VPLDVSVAVPAGGALNLTIALTVPQTMAVVAASPKLTVTSPPSWNASVPGGSTAHFTVWLRLPEAIGTYNVGVGVGYQGQLPFTRKSAAFQTVADRAAMEAAETADLNTLKSKAPAKDLGAINAAIHDLTDIKAATPTTTAGAADVLDDVL